MLKNYFRYKDDFFLQIKGTSMGSTMAPNYTNLYAGLFEHNFIFNGLQNPFLQNIVFWQMYIDDHFMLWSGIENLSNNFRNTSDEHFNFTVNYDDSCVCFLEIITDLYRKPTDRNTLLHGQSYHPTTLKCSLPISQFNQICRICSTEQSYTQQSNDLINRFRERGCNQKHV